MKFRDIAENLRTTGRKFKWARSVLITRSSDSPTAHCALGIKAREFGVPAVTLAYAQMSDTLAKYVKFRLHPIYELNDNARDYEGVIEALDKQDQRGLQEPDIEGWVVYLHTLTPEAVKWATDHGYQSLLEELPRGGA